MGRAVLGKLIAEVPDDNSDSLILLDLEGPAVATASFLREVVLGFRAYFARMERTVLPANPAQGVLEELEYVLRSSREALVVVTVGKDDEILAARVIGYLDEKQMQTLNAVLARGEADASTLVKEHQDEAIGITGWNNRLAALAAKGILAERRIGRAKRYRAVVEHLRHGN